MPVVRVIPEVQVMLAGVGLVVAVAGLVVLTGTTALVLSLFLARIKAVEVRRTPVRVLEVAVLRGVRLFL